MITFWRWRTIPPGRQTPNCICRTGWAPARRDERLPGLAGHMAWIHDYDELAR